ncbi:MAG TPA: histone deacetylase [Terriglobales bacterium]|nr:histone deacetylase [Terriglobales bacterium]
MADTGIVIDRRYLDHHTGPGHPERPQRIAALIDLIEDAGAHLARIEPRPAEGDELALVHDGAYVEEVAATRSRQHHSFDPDTPASPLSFDTACLAAGGVLSLIDAVMAQEVRNGFAFVRPPGHHAERERAMGFCLFNNVAVGAAYLRRHHGLDRVMIVDWDLHHGNGTQHMFENDPGVLFVSTHQYPFYPGTGALDESGRRDGTGYTVNLPLPAGCGDAEYAEVFERIVVPIAHQYQPQFILISAGFDAHARDPLGGMNVTEAGFAAMTEQILAVAKDHAGGRCAAILEGGYDLDAICASASAVLTRFEGQGEPAAIAGQSRIAPLTERFRQNHGNNWRL